MSPFHPIEMSLEGRSTVDYVSLGLRMVKGRAQERDVAIPSVESLQRAAGGCLSIAEIAAALGCSCRRAAGLVDAWARARRILPLPSGSETWLPAYQLDVARRRPHPVVAAVLAELHGVFGEAELLLWFATPNLWLGDRTPAELIAIDARAVAGASRADRFVACG